MLPGQPYINYGVSLDSALPGAINLAFVVLVIISDAAPVEKTQRALDAYLGAGQDTEGVSVPDAVEADQTLGGLVHYIQAVTTSSYGRIEYAGQGYFGARINLQAGAI